MNRNDKKLLADAVASNGGGVRYERYPKAAVDRLLKQELIQVKPNKSHSLQHAFLLTATKAGVLAHQNPGEQS